MNKKGIIFAILMLVACATKPEEQKFVNPIFYETLEPLSSGTWQAKITPTSLIRNRKGTVSEQKCTLIENTMDAVTLRCAWDDQPSNILDYRFVPDWENKNYKRILVRLNFKSPDAISQGSTETYTIDNQN